MAEATVALSARISEGTRADIDALLAEERCTVRTLLERAIEAYKARKRESGQAAAE